MTDLQAWLKRQSPSVQTFLYAVETGVVAALVLFLTAVYTALQSPHGLDGFDWPAQLRTLEIACGAAVTKAVLDILKGTPPTQTNGGSP